MASGTWVLPSCWGPWKNHRVSNLMRVGVAVPSEGLGSSQLARAGVDKEGSSCPQALSPLADSGICRRILHVLYTDCIRQCSGPLYVVPPGLPALPHIYSLPSGGREGRGASQSPGEAGGPADLGLLPLLSLSLFPSLSPRVSASLQDRMVLLVMGNIINWSL